MNFLKETMKAISESGHTPWDITYIGSADGYSCDWEKFKVLSDVVYDAGYGSVKVPSDLVIVFYDGQYLERREYDGSEWWEVVKPFAIPGAMFRTPITRVVAGGGEYGYRLKDLNTKKK